MLNFIRRKLRKRQLKRTFREYGHEIQVFQIAPFGRVEYARWKHPFDKPVELNEAGVRFYQTICPPGSMAIDIGAYTGDTTVPMALAVGREGLVLALEPNPYAFRILEKNAALNPSLTRILPLNFAATAEDGAFTFNYSDASFCNGGFLDQIERSDHKHHYTLEVEGKNLEQYLLARHSKDLDRLALIKVDAEGYDKEILKTIPAILARSKPALLIECYKKLTRAERTELFQVVRGYGYHLYYLEDFEHLDTLRELQLKNMSDERHFEMIALHADRLADYAITYT